MRSILSFFALLPAVFTAPIQERQAANAVPNQWIVRVPSSAAVDNVISSITNILNVGDLDILSRYSFGNFKGFAFKSSASAAEVRLINALAGVLTIEQDRVVTIDALTSQSPAPSYGLARISTRNRGPTDYVYDTTAGQGTYAYIIDTGIYTGHSDFGGRATFGANFARDGSGNVDGNGHGTHVAGTTGGTKYGVAKKTNLIAVKVLGTDGSGYNSDIISGIDWAVNDAQNKGRIGKAVANLSLGGGYSSVTNDAANEAVAAGLFMAVAAGNDNADAANYSPASAANVCTVGAIDNTDTRASYSNYGSIVDIFAPGTGITSDWIDSSTDTNTISGTSMATPHITGLGAYILALEGSYSGKGLCDRLIQLSTKNVVASVNGSPNRLGYNGNGRR